MLAKTISTILYAFGFLIICVVPLMVLVEVIENNKAATIAAGIFAGTLVLGFAAVIDLLYQILVKLEAKNQSETAGNDEIAS